MDINKLALFNMAKIRMDWGTERGRVLAQNVANLDTPAYKARDVEALNFRQLALRESHQVRIAQTSAGHLAPPHATPRFDQHTERQPYETSRDGNSVVLEEQMLKVKSTKGAYDRANALYGKYASLFKTAIGKGQ